MDGDENGYFHGGRDSSSAFNSSAYMSSPYSSGAGFRGNSSGISDGYSQDGPSFLVSPAPREVNSIREIQNELERVKKINFDLRLKIYHLDEVVSRIRPGTQMSEVVQQVVEQKVALEEKGRELEDRGRLLVKARSAIAQLQDELQRLQSGHPDTEVRQRLDAERNLNVELERQLIDAEHRFAEQAREANLMRESFDEANIRAERSSALEKQTAAVAEELRNRVSELQAALDETKTRCERAERDSRDSALRLEERIKENEDLRNRLQASELLSKQHVDSISDAERRISAAGTENTGLRRRIEMMQGEIEAMQQREQALLSDARTRDGEFEQRLRELQTNEYERTRQLAKSEGELDVLRTQLTDYEERLARSEAELRTRNTELQTVVHRCQAVEEEWQLTETEMQRREQDLREQYEAVVSKITRERDGLIHELDRMEDEMRAIKEAASSQQQQREDAEKQVSQVSMRSEVAEKHLRQRLLDLTRFVISFGRSIDTLLSSYPSSLTSIASSSSSSSSHYQHKPLSSYSYSYSSSSSLSMSASDAEAAVAYIMAEGPSEDSSNNSSSRLQSLKDDLSRKLKALSTIKLSMDSYLENSERCKRDVEHAFNAKMASKSKALEGIASKMNALSILVRRLQVDRKSYLSRATKSERLVATLQADCETVASRAKRLEKEVEDRQAKVLQGSKERMALTSRISELEAKISEHQMMADSSVRRVSDEMDTALSDSRKKMVELQAKHDVLAENNRLIISELEEKNTLARHYASKYKRDHGKLGQYRTEIERLRTEVTEKHTECAMLREQIAKKLLELRQPPVSSHPSLQQQLSEFSHQQHRYQQLPHSQSLPQPLPSSYLPASSSLPVAAASASAAVSSASLPHTYPHPRSSSVSVSPESAMLPQYSSYQPVQSQQYYQQQQQQQRPSYSSQFLPLESDMYQPQQQYQQQPRVGSSDQMSAFSRRSS